MPDSGRLPSSSILFVLSPPRLSYTRDLESGHAHGGLKGMVVAPPHAPSLVRALQWESTPLSSGYAAVP
jgi:hypothetical protein